MKQAHPGQRLTLWWQDEARIGQQGTLTTVWAKKGSRPTALKQTEYEWVYLWAAVEPRTGRSVALLGPRVDTAWMNAYLRQFSQALAPDEHALLVLDNAGWHVAKDLQIPANVTLWFLPPYSPELNPVERIWAYLRQHYLSNRVYRDYDELFTVVGDAYRALDDARLASLTRMPWLDQIA